MSRRAKTRVRRKQGPAKDAKADEGHADWHGPFSLAFWRGAAETLRPDWAEKKGAKPKSSGSTAKKGDSTYDSGVRRRRTGTKMPHT